MRITDPEVAKAVIAHEAAECYVGKEGPVSAQPAALVSCIGGTFWGKPGEAWPRAAGGTPLFPWLQIVCTEMERLSAPFHRRQAVCFFLREEFYEADAS